MSIDLTPFGFTPTESLVYSGLLDRGFTSAYALAKTVGLARANAYQALHGLVSKGAAVMVSDSPQVFRPVGPAELLALVSQRQAARLDELESQVAQHGRHGQPTTVPFSGKREFAELVLRTAARATSVSCAASPSLLAALNPVWRKRAQDGSETSLWSIGDSFPDAPIEIVGTISADQVFEYFEGSAVLLVTDDHAMVGRHPPDGDLSGLWSSDAIMCGLVRAALSVLTGS